MWPDLEEALARARRAPVRARPGVARTPPRSRCSRGSTTALGAGAVMLYQRDDGPDVTVVAAGTPVIVLGPRLAAEGDAGPAREIRALLARAVELTRPEHLAFAGLPPRDATRLAASVVAPVRPAGAARRGLGAARRRGRPARARRDGQGRAAGQAPHAPRAAARDAAAGRARRRALPRRVPARRRSRRAARSAATRT